MLVELLKTTSMPAEQIRQRVRITNLQTVQTYLAGGKSVLLVAAHQCNWEWMLLGLSLELGISAGCGLQTAGGQLGPSAK